MYPDIFGLDPLPFPFPPHGHRHGPHNDPYIKETTKVAEIKDRFMKTRYKVVLTDFDDAPEHDDLTRPDTVFQVTAISFNYDQPLEITHRDFRNYEDAVKFFSQTVDQLQALAKLDSRDAQDIRIYAEKTGYHRIDPDCCRNCKWAKPADKRNCMFKEWRNRLRRKFFCMNSELYSKCMPDLVPDEGQHDDYHDFAQTRWNVIDITPEVDPDGICSGYERQSKETPPCPPPRPPMPPPCPPGPFTPTPPPTPYLPGPLPHGRP